MLELSALVGEHKQNVNRCGETYLSKQEQNILALMGREYDDVAIMQVLNIALATVRKHRQHIYIKLNVRSDRDAILVAYRARCRGRKLISHHHVTPRHGTAGSC
jgi:DNA-binding CsgD family transcriptional regulator